jgi:hypothetical protein
MVSCLDSPAGLICQSSERLQVYFRAKNCRDGHFSPREMTCIYENVSLSVVGNARATSRCAG